MHRMRRFSCILMALLAPVLAFRGVASAEDPKPAAEPPKVATDEEVAAALEKFKEEFKAKGLKGEERTSQRDFAMGQVSKVQHRDVVDALARVTNDPDGILRTLAVIYLGEQKACPGSAGLKVAAAMKKGSDDTVLVMSALQSLGSLKYLGARDALKALLKDQDFAVKKSAIKAVGDIGDMRLLDDLLLIAGIVVNTDRDGKSGSDPEKKDGGKETTQEGYSWDGAEASVDTGSSGDGDQKAAEAAAKAKMAANKAAADAAHAGSGSGGTTPSGGASTGGESAAGPRGAASRTTQELIPFIRDALKKLTGEQFHGAADIKKWLSEHRAEIVAKKKTLDDAERLQAEAAKR